MTFEDAPESIPYQASSPSGEPQRVFAASQTPFFYLELSTYWFALSFLWAGMLTIIPQTLIEEMVGKQKKDLYLGLALAVGALVSTIVSLIIGTLSDHSRWELGKRRPYLIVGTILAVPAILWIAHVRTVWGLIAAMSVLQLFLAVSTAPYQAMLPDMVPKERQGTASAYMGLGSLLGQLGGLITCSQLIAKPGGLEKIVEIFSVLLVVTMLVTTWRVPEQSARSNTPLRAGVLNALVQSFKVNPREHPDFFWMIASRFVINMGFYSATQFLEYYVKDTLRAPNPAAVVGQLFILTTVAGLLGNFPAGILADRVSKKLVVYISAAITGVAALVFLLTSSITVAMVAAFIFGAGFGAFQAVDWALATNLLPDRDEAKFMGIWHVAFTVPQVVAPLIGGLIAYAFNQGVSQGFGYRAVLFMVILYLAAGTMLLRPVRERQKSAG